MQKNINPFKLHKTALVLLALFLIFFVLSLYFLVIRFTNKTANLSLSVDNIYEIHDLRADGFFACFIDEYERSSSNWSFSGDLMIKSIFEKSLEAFIKDEGWVPVSQIYLNSMDNEIHDLGIPQLHFERRVDYELTTGSGSPDNKEQHIPSVLSYINHTNEDFGYYISAPIIYADFFWSSDKDEETSEYMEVITFDDSISMNADTEDSHYVNITSNRFRIRSKHFFDDKAGGYWMGVPVCFVGQSDNSVIYFQFAPNSKALSEDAGKTIVRAYYPSEFDATVSGRLSFRNGIRNDDCTLCRERIAFTIDPYENEKMKSEVTSYGEISFNFDGGASIGINELHHPILSIDTVIDPNTRNRTDPFHFNTRVTAATLNNHSFFPNIRTFFVDNWKDVTMFSVVVSFVLFFIKMKLEERGKNRESYNKKENRADRNINVSGEKEENMEIISAASIPKAQQGFSDQRKNNSDSDSETTPCAVENEVTICDFITPTTNTQSQSETALMQKLSECNKSETGLISCSELETISEDCDQNIPREMQ